MYMLLRRVIGHVEEQNWAAVALDFFIVVSGVFIGMQLGNWNESRQTQSAFVEAKTRLVAESRANMETTERFLIDVDRRMELARGALTVLRNCASDETAHKQLLDGAEAIRGTATLHLRQTALSAITGNDGFLSLLDAQERERLKEFERRLTQSGTTLNWLEHRPFTQHIEDAPYLNYSELVELGSGTEVKIRNLELEAPLDEVCQDSEFRKPFYLWERTATFQSLRARQIQKWLQENLEIMG